MKGRRGITIVVGAILTLAGLLLLTAGVHTKSQSGPLVAPAMPADMNGFGIEVAGALAYVEAWNILIYDISEPLAAHLLGVIPPPAGGQGWMEFDVVDNRLYAFELHIGAPPWEGILHVYDVSNPGLPAELTQIQGLFMPFGFPGYVKASADNRYVHLSHSDEEGIIIYDISDLSQPRRVSTYATECSSGEFSLRGQYAYVHRDCDVSFQAFEIAVYDIADPMHPKLVSNESLRELTLYVTSFDFDALGNDIYIATSQHVEGGGSRCGVKIIDIANPSSPVLRGQLDLGESSYGCFGNIHVQNKLLYGAQFIYRPNDSWQDLITFDANDPNDIHSVAHYQLPSTSTVSFGYFDLSETCIIAQHTHGANTGGLHIVCATDVAGATPTPSSTPIPTVTSSVSPTPTPTSTATNAPTVTASASPTDTPSPTSADTATPTATPTNTPTTTVTHESVYLPLLAR